MALTENHVQVVGLYVNDYQFWVLVINFGLSEKSGGGGCAFWSSLKLSAQQW
jgi:hypothetical protein